MEKIRWTDNVRNEVLQRIKEERDIVHRVKLKKKAKIIGRILHRTCRLKHFD